MQESAKFAVGQTVRHLRFGYRGVVVDVDPDFQLSDDWYDQVARSRPPKDKPWYHVLVDEASHMTYVAERHLEADDSGEPVRHPAVDQVFDRFENGAYVKSRRMN
jgi:heat shock protein HspQ